jgi:hypothetical protein
VRSYRTLSPLPVPAGFPTEAWRFAFCGTFLGVTPTGRYPAPCPVELGLSSPGLRTGEPDLDRRRSPGPLRRKHAPLGSRRTRESQGARTSPISPHAHHPRAPARPRVPASASPPLNAVGFASAFSALCRRRSRVDRARAGARAGGASDVDRGLCPLDVCRPKWWYGRFRFARIPPGGYVLVCRSAGSTTEECVLWVEGGENGAEPILLQRAAPLSKIVHDEWGTQDLGSRATVALFPRPLIGVAGPVLEQLQPFESPWGSGRGRSSYGAGLVAVFAPL